MKVLAWVHLYPPDHCAGAEMMLHEILLGLKERHHSVHVMVNDSTAGSFEGVPITAQDNRESLGLINWADVIITHLDKTPQVVSAVGNRRPLVHLVHNHRQLDYHGVSPKYAQLVVANSKWIAEAIHWPGKTIVVPPPVRPSRYATTPGDRITLINLCKDKGGEVFWQLVKKMPDQKFLGVVGGYYEQIVPSVIPKNAIVMPHTPDITEAYAQTRILLCPSHYESWGRVGIEAAASGIPTIASPTPGLMESLGESGTFVSPDDIDGWIAAIRELQDPTAYKAKSDLALRRSAELEPDPYIDLLEQQLRELVTQYQQRRG
jgi:glycosyltransferase involved in cell wall biosynthesis